jgi:hypothetical protein
MMCVYDKCYHVKSGVKLMLYHFIFAEGKPYDIACSHHHLSRWWSHAASSDWQESSREQAVG